MGDVLNVKKRSVEDNDDSVLRLVEPQILLVDDEPEVVEVLSELLQQERILVDTATTSPLALQMLSKKPYLAVISDIRMPDLDGFEFMAMARKNEFYQPFVFITGATQRDLILTAVRLGAADFISKPFQIEEIRQVLYRIEEIGARWRRFEEELAAVSPEMLVKLRSTLHTESLLQICNARRKKRHVAG